MENSISSFVTKLIPLIDTDRDGLLFIDGAWGTGKTHFIKTRLKGLYDKNTYFYISLLGISSLEDFKSKIIECYYLADAENITHQINSIADSASLLRGSPDDSGVIKSLFNSIGASIKGKVLSSLSGIFILDDIERVDKEEVTSLILNYCHTLYSQKESQKLDFIVVGNTSKEASFEITHKEKLISDTISFTPNFEELCDIILPRLSPLPETDKQAFLNIIKNQDIVNLRIINRCIDKILPLYEYINSNPDKEWNVRSSDVIGCITSSIILHHSHNKSIEILHKHSPKNYLINQDDNDSYSEKELWTLYRKYAIPDIVRDYSMGLESSQSTQEVIFSTPKKMSLDDIAIADQPHIHDVDEISLSQCFHEIITKKRIVPIYSWMLMVRNYIFLTENEYLPTNPLLSKDYIEQMANDFSLEEISDFIDKKGGFDHLRRYGLSSMNQDPYMNIFLNKYESHITAATIKSLRHAVAYDGWYSIDTTKSIDSLDDYSRFRPLQIIGSSFLLKHLLLSWKPIDIESFDSYLANLYAFSNIREYLCEEKPHLIRLEIHTYIYLRSKKPNFKYGAIKRLNGTLNEILTRL